MVKCCYWQWADSKRIGALQLNSNFRRMWSQNAQTITSRSTYLHFRSPSHEW